MGKINTDNYPNRPFSSYQDDDMFVLQDNGGETYTTNVGDVKNLADSRIKLEGVQVNGTDLPISGKKVNVDISGKTDLSVIAYTFNSEMGYFKGAYVTYNGKLYEFIQEHTGAWNPSHVREIRASGQYVRAGNGGYNNGDRATCEGYMTKASGNYSHAEGRETQAVGECTHAEGRETIANSIYQHVEGKYNIADNESKYIHIIGNGIDDNNRSNAMTLDWDGNLEVSGEVENGNGEKISDKADKVTNATSGHLAGLDSNGNLTDSGVSPTEEVTVEGNPVTFDSPFEQDAKSVVVSVKPIQDLHGYDHPWVGGAGKNKLPLTVDGIKAANSGATWTGNSTTINGVTFTILTDSDGNVTGIHAEGTANNNILYFKLITNLTIDTPMIFSTGHTYTWGINGRVMEVSDGNTTYKPSVVSGVEVPVGTYEVHIAVAAGYTINDDYQPMLRLATETDATFAPYSNICPISGIDEVEIEVSGKNLLDVGNDISEWLGTSNDGTTISSYPISNKVTANLDRSTGSIVVTNYDTSGWWWMSKEIKLAKNTNYKFVNLMVGKKLVGFNSLDDGTTGTVIAESDSDSVFNSGDYNYWVISIFPLNVSTNNVMVINDGVVDTEFEPYKSAPTTTTIPLPQTVYDADVDVTNGSGDSRYGIVDLGDLTWNKEGNVFWTGLTGKKAGRTNLKCEIYKIVDKSAWDTVFGEMTGDSGNATVSTHDDRFADATEFTNFVSGHKLCYELATPTTISFDPTDVELLEGDNVVTTNGEKVAVTYGRSLWQDIDDLKSDTEGKLDKSDVADVEGDTASKAYAVNDFMLRADGLYKVTAPIASGASITSSNTTKTTIGAVLTALLNS